MVHLTDAEGQALIKLAKREKRSVSDQIAWLVLEGMRAEKALPPNPVLEAHRKRSH